MVEVVVANDGAEGFAAELASVRRDGISAAVGWQGGGGFRFMRLGEPVFSADGRIHAEAFGTGGVAA